MLSPTVASVSEGGIVIMVLSEETKKLYVLIKMCIKIAVIEGGLYCSGYDFKLAQMFCNKGNSLYIEIILDHSYGSTTATLCS